MCDIVPAVRLIAHLKIPLLIGIACSVFIFNLWSIAVRKTLFRLIGAGGAQWFTVAVRIALYALVPALLAGYLAVYLLPALMHGGYPLPLSVLRYGALPILRLAMIPACIAAMAVTIPYCRTFVCRNPYVVDSLSAAVCFVFFAHHALYSGYPALFESSLGNGLIPSPAVVMVILLTVSTVTGFGIYLLDRLLSGWYAACHNVRKRLLPAVCATLIQCVPLMLISQIICCRLETALDAGAQEYDPVSYAHYIELFMYAELYLMIDGNDVGRQLFDAVVSQPHTGCRRYRTVTARVYNTSDCSPLDVPFSSNSWRNVALWYNTR